MKKLRLALLASVFPLGSLAAQGFEAENHLVVVPLSASTFEVIEARGEGARGMWCAAADYAIARLPRGDGRIYLLGARGPARSVAGRKGAVFTNDPSLLKVPANTGVSVTVRQVGRSLPIDHAYQFCRDFDRDRIIIPVN